MDEKYSVGSGTSTMNLLVKVGTAAKGATEITQNLLGGATKSLGISSNGNNGTISLAIGTSDSLKNTSIICQTVADIGALPATVQTAIQTDTTALRNGIAIEYTINGGPGGTEQFSYDDDDIFINGTQVYITKQINMLP